ncbi:MAG: galactokinase [Candidatus Hydrogenedens sp.]|nr:galactokinase [Candidatus Hydrogenedens sp.]
MTADTLRKLFHERYPSQSEPFVCRAPGRVNLIGEHMDYNGLPVLPMAIRQEILIAFAPRTDSRVVMQNVEPRFSPVEFENAATITRSAQGSWDNYTKAAFQKLNAELEPEHFPGVDMLVSSTLPTAAGLSSSSALVVASALVYLAVLDQILEEDITRLELADMMAEAEHYVGTRGGGMDQTCILNALDGHACKIDFFPLRVEAPPIPEGAAIVVCDSTVKVEKSGDALLRFNRGPRFCALGTALVERYLQDAIDEDIEIDRLGDIWLGPLCLTMDEGAGYIDAAIPEDRLTLAEIAKRLEMKPAKVASLYLEDMPEPEGGYPLRAMLRHQYSEFARVELARDALLANDTEEFGRLMNESHQSCADDFFISSRELDALVGAAREAGALGSRLTGAGFGGATVNLVPEQEVERFVERVGQLYYRDFLGRDGEPPIFVAHPSDGAGYL